MTAEPTRMEALSSPLSSLGTSFQETELQTFSKHVMVQGTHALSSMLLSPLQVDLSVRDPASEVSEEGIQEVRPQIRENAFADVQEETSMVEVHARETELEHLMQERISIMTVLQSKLQAADAKVNSARFDFVNLKKSCCSGAA